MSDEKNPDLFGEFLNDPKNREALLIGFKEYMEVHTIQKSDEEIKKYEDQEVMTLLNNYLTGSLFQESEQSGLMAMLPLASLVISAITMIIVLVKK